MSRTHRWNDPHEHPLLEVTLGLLANLAPVGLFAFYPGQWLGLW